MIVALDEPQHVFGSDITRQNIVKTTYTKPVDNSQDSPFIKTIQQSAVQNTSSVENLKDEVAQNPSSIALPDVSVNNKGLQQVADLLQAPPQDEVAQASPLLDDLAEIKQGLQQCFDLLHQQAPPQEDVAQNIVETRQESSTREGDTRTKLLKKLDDVSASMQLLAVEFDGNVDKVDESLRDRISKFQDEVQCSMKVIIKKVEVDARTDEQDDEVENHESCAIVLDQNEGFNLMIINQMQEDIKNIVLSSSTVAKPCAFNNKDLEVEGASSRITLQEGASNKQGPPQDDVDIIGPESKVDQGHDMRHHDGEEPPQEETKEAEPSQDDVETPDSMPHSSKIMQEEGVRNKQVPLQDAAEVKDPSVESNQEYDLQFPSLHPCNKEALSKERMNDDAGEKKAMHNGDVKQSPEIIAEICKREVAVVGTHAGMNRFSLGEYFTFTKTTGSKKAKRKP